MSRKSRKRTLYLSLQTFSSNSLIKDATHTLLSFILEKYCKIGERTFLGRKKETVWTVRSPRLSWVMSTTTTTGTDVLQKKNENPTRTNNLAMRRWKEEEDEQQKESKKHMYLTFKIPNSSVLSSKTQFCIEFFDTIDRKNDVSSFCFSSKSKVLSSPLSKSLLHSQLHPGFSNHRSNSVT